MQSYDIDESLWKIEEKFFGSLGDGFYIYKFNAEQDKFRLWGWANTVDEAKGLIKTETVKKNAKKSTRASRIPF